MLKIGLIGAGYMMQVVHLPSLRAIDGINGIEVVAIADLDTSLAERVARAWGIPRTYVSAEALVAGESELDGVVVVTAKQYHANACLPALKRGVATLVEKPLTTTIEDAREMVEIAERTGALLMVGYMKRFDPAIRELRRQIDNGAIGDLRYARLHDFGGNWTAGAPQLGIFKLDDASASAGPVRPRPAFANKREEAINEWLEVWIHDVNLARTLFGEPRSIVYATNELPRLALIEFERGRVLLEMGAVAYPGAPWDERITIYGSAGRAEVVFPAPLLFRKSTDLIVSNSAGETRPQLPDRESFTEEMLHFLNCVKRCEQPLTAGRDALADIELCVNIVDAAMGAVGSNTLPSENATSTLP